MTETSTNLAAQSNYCGTRGSGRLRLLLGRGRNKACCGVVFSVMWQVRSMRFTGSEHDAVTHVCVAHKIKREGLFSGNSLTVLRVSCSLLRGWVLEAGTKRLFISGWVFFFCSSVLKHEDLISFLCFIYLYIMYIQLLYIFYESTICVFICCVYSVICFFQGR